MAVKVTEATIEEIREFDKKEWRKANVVFYGSSVVWVGKRFIFKATKDGKIIGAAKGNYKAGVVYINAMIVDEIERRRGVGKKLIEKIGNWGKHLGAHKIFLFTMEEWEANKFYRKLGFKKTGDLPKHFLKKDFVIFSKYI